MESKRFLKVTCTNKEKAIRSSLKANAASASSVYSCFLNYIQICAFYKVQINSAILEKTNFMSVIVRLACLELIGT